tara:strand:- start:7334 stop:7477 length:144 start_codon:yes stop_codon:yes gene_type:complete
MEGAIEEEHAKGDKHSKDAPYNTNLLFMLFLEEHRVSGYTNSVAIIS